MLSKLKLKYEPFVRNLSSFFEKENILTVRSNTTETIVLLENGNISLPINLKEIYENYFSTEKCVETIIKEMRED